jgi:hypothetical protein
MGRVSTYPKKQGEEICERLSEGEMLEDICRDPHMPAVRTVSSWRKLFPPFDADIARAREAGWDAIAARSRRTLRGMGPEEGGDSTGDVVRDKAIADHDLKLLSKWDHTRYGDRSTLTHEGNIGKATAADPDGLMVEIMLMITSGRVKLPNGHQIIEVDDDELDVEDPHGVG